MDIERLCVFNAAFPADIDEDLKIERAQKEARRNEIACRSASAHRYLKIQSFNDFRRVV
jgi:hypothetical protein